MDPPQLPGPAAQQGIVAVAQHGDQTKTRARKKVKKKIRMKVKKSELAEIRKRKEERHGHHSVEPPLKLESLEEPAIPSPSEFDTPEKCDAILNDPSVEIAKRIQALSCYAHHLLNQADAAGKILANSDEISRARALYGRAIDYLQRATTLLDDQTTSPQPLHTRYHVYKGLADALFSAFVKTTPANVKPEERERATRECIANYHRVLELQPTDQRSTFHCGVALYKLAKFKLKSELQTDIDRMRVEFTEAEHKFETVAAYLQQPASRDSATTTTASASSIPESVLLIEWAKCLYNYAKFYQVQKLYTDAYTRYTRCTHLLNRGIRVMTSSRDSKLFSGAIILWAKTLDKQAYMKRKHMRDRNEQDLYADAEQLMAHLMEFNPPLTREQLTAALDKLLERVQTPLTHLNKLVMRSAPLPKIIDVDTQLAEEAKKALRASGLSKEEIQGNADVFLNCLWFQLGIHPSHLLDPHYHSYGSKKLKGSRKSAKVDKEAVAAEAPSGGTPQLRRAGSAGSGLTAGADFATGSANESAEPAEPTGTRPGRRGSFLNVFAAFKRSTARHSGKTDGASIAAASATAAATAQVDEAGNSEETLKLIENSQLGKLLIKENPKKLFVGKQHIGKGGFGEVYTAKRKQDNLKVAIKVMKRKLADDYRHIEKEITLLSSCQHRNIVNYLNSYLFSDTIWLVMEYCDGGTLAHLRSEVQLSESQLAYLAREILQGLEYLHSNHHIHRDIKAENILLNLSGEVKVADLGLSAEMDEPTAAAASTLTGSGGSDSPTLPQKATKRATVAGSKYWMAPEMIRRERYNEKVDIYSFGCLMVEMIDGRPPYRKHHPIKALFYTATRGAPKPLVENAKSLSKELLDFLDKALQLDPAVRWSASQLLKHPFLKKAGKKADISKLFEFVFLGNSLRMNGF